MGEAVSATNPSYLTMYMIRIQQKNVTVNETEDNLGSILFADSFYHISEKSLNLTKNVPNMLCFYTTHLHYQYCNTTWYTEKNIRCERLGERQFVINKIDGVYPLKQKYLEVVPDFILKGKLVVYEKAIIFQDSTLHNFIMDFDTIQKVIFHTGNTTWAEIIVDSTT